MIAKKGVLLTDGAVSIIFVQQYELWEWRGEISMSMDELRAAGANCDGGAFDIQKLSKCYSGKARVYRWEDGRAEFVGSGPLSVDGVEVELPQSRWAGA